MAFIRKAVDIANEHPRMFPSAFLDEMRKDAQLLDDLSPISLAIRLLHARSPVYRPRISEMSLERIPCIHGFLHANPINPARRPGVTRE